MKQLDAFYFSYKKHYGQLDDTGKPYIIHPVQVWEILKKVTDDDEILSAALLHDTLEDIKTTYNELEENFGKRVADLVNEVTHDGKKDNFGYYFPRLKTRDGILIKFADRLSNLSRMESWDEKRIQHYLKKSKFWKSEKIGMVDYSKPLAQALFMDTHGKEIIDFIHRCEENMIDLSKVIYDLGGKNEIIFMGLRVLI